NVSQLARHRPRVNEFAARDVLELLRSRLPPERLVAMRVTAKPPHHVAMSARLRRGELEPPAHLRGPFLDERLHQLDDSVEMRRVLRMTERQREEELLPVRAQRRVVTVVEAVECQGRGFPVLGEGVCRSAMNGARELVERDDEREP